MSTTILNASTDLLDGFKSAENFQPIQPGGKLLLKFKRPKLSGKEIPTPSSESEFKTICYECKYGRSSKSKNGWYRCRLVLKHTDPDFKAINETPLDSDQPATHSNKRIRIVCKLPIPLQEGGMGESTEPRAATCDEGSAGLIDAGHPCQLVSLGDAADQPSDAEASVLPDSETIPHHPGFPADNSEISHEAEYFGTNTALLLASHFAPSQHGNMWDSVYGPPSWPDASAIYYPSPPAFPPAPSAAADSGPWPLADSLLPAPDYGAAGLYGDGLTAAGEARTSVLVDRSVARAWNSPPRP